MDDETARRPEDGHSEADAPQEHYWSMEHYSFRDRTAEPQAHRATHGRRNRLVAAAVLTITLVAGVGSVAVAQAGGTAPPGGAGFTAAQAPAVDPAPAVDRRDGFGRGDRPGLGR